MKVTCGNKKCGEQSAIQDPELATPDGKVQWLCPVCGTINETDNPAGVDYHDPAAADGDGDGDE